MMETLRSNIADGVMRLTLARPLLLNAINHQMMAEVTAIMTEAERSDEVKAIVLTGEGRAFCSGYDMKESASFTEYDADQWLGEFDLFRDFVMQFWCHSKPTIAAVHGHCIGGGMDLALACDLTIAAEDTQFGMPEVRNGSGLPLILLPWLAGPKIAKEIVLGGRIDVSAARLAQLGLLNEVVTPERHVERALELAAHIVKAPALAVRLAKKGINRSYQIRGMLDALKADAPLGVALELAETSERKAFNEIRRTSGLKAALEWRVQQ